MLEAQPIESRSPPPTPFWAIASAGFAMSGLGMWLCILFDERALSFALWSVAILVVIRLVTLVGVRLRGRTTVNRAGESARNVSWMERRAFLISACVLAVIILGLACLAAVLVDASVAALLFQADLLMVLSAAALILAGDALRDLIHFLRNWR